MDPHIDTTTIRDRINEIRSALFFNEGRYPAVYSAGIISALEVDQDGQIFFFISRPEYIPCEDRRFPARLEFYRKGKPYFVKVNGVAEIVGDACQAQKYFNAYGFQKDMAGKKLALVKVMVQQAEYNTDPQPINMAYFKKMFQQVVAWFSMLRTFNYSNG